MLNSKTRLSALCLLLLPTFMHAELTVNANNHKAVVDNHDLELPAPRALTAVGVPAALGALVFAACSEGNGTATAVGAAIGGAFGLREHLAYSGAHQASDGLNLAGATAAHNLDGVKKLLAYSDGWYAFKSIICFQQNHWFTVLKHPIGSPQEVDETGKTALHYAGAFNNILAAKEILKAAPKKITTYEETGRSKVTQSPVHTVSGALGASAASGIFGPRAGAAGGLGSSSTFGGNKEKVDERAIHQTYVDLKDDAGRTAANWAARARAVEILLFFADRGADSNVQDNTQQSVNTLSENDPVLQKAVNQARGK